LPAKYKGKDDDVIEKVYDLLVKEVVPLKSQIEAIERYLSVRNGANEKICNDLDNRITKLEDNMIGKKLFIAITIIIGVLFLPFNVIQIIFQIKSLIGG